MIKINTETGKIVCPAGDTGAITINLTDGYGGPITGGITGVGVFAVANKKLTATYLTKVSAIVDNTVTIQFTNADTRDIPAGAYVWDLRVVTDPDYDENNNVVCTDSSDADDQVHSVYSISGFPEFIVTGVVISV